ncbi:hypothetical protein [Streptomyces bacillaris]
MDQPVLSWLLAQLGTSTDVADLEARFTRLGSARRRPGSPGRTPREAPR